MLREQYGLSYGVTSYLEARPGLAVFSIEGMVRTNATDSALTLVRAALQALGEGDVTQAEREAAVQGLIGSFPSSIATAQALRSRLISLRAWRAPLGFYSTYRENLAALGVSELNQAAARLFPEDGTIYVVVGDLAAIETRIRSLDIGPVEVWDAEGSRTR